MIRVDQGARFGSLEELRTMIEEKAVGPGEGIEMDRLQYAAYKELVWKWLQDLNPIMVFRGHPIAVIKRGGDNAADLA